MKEPSEDLVQHPSCFGRDVYVAAAWFERIVYEDVPMDMLLDFP